MNKLKLIVSIISFLGLSVSNISGITINSGANDSTTTSLAKQNSDSATIKKTAIAGIVATQQQLDEITTPMLMALNKEVTLTDTQRTQIKKIADIYAQKLINARAMKSKTDSYSYMQTVTTEYEQALSELLTTAQKEQKTKNFKRKMEEISKSANSK